MARVNWEFEEQEVETIRSVVRTSSGDPFVDQRIKRNVEPTGVEVSRPRIWQAHLAAQLTSQQRSGPDSPVSQFLTDELDRLSLKRCRESNDVASLVAERLEQYGGIRFYNKIGKACARNLQLLDHPNHEGWEELEAEVTALSTFRKRNPQPSDAEREREACWVLSDDLRGEGLHRVGPKQSRNMLQSLGLTRYETPLDSRITQWLSENVDLPYVLSADALSNHGFYNFHMDLVQSACVRAEVLPCVFDAAVFISYDREWSEEDAQQIVF